MHIGFSLFCFVATFKKTWHGGTIVRSWLKQIHSLKELARSIFEFGSILSLMNFSYGGIIINGYLFIIKKSILWLFSIMCGERKVLTGTIKYSLMQFVFYIRYKPTLSDGNSQASDFSLDVGNKWWNFPGHFLGHFLK